METFKAKLGTVFRYNADLTGEVYIQFANESESGRSLARVTYRGNAITTVQIPFEDFLEFAAHASGVPQTSEQQSATAAAYVMDQLRRIGMFDRVTAEKEIEVRELFSKLFAGQPLEPLDAYDQETKRLASQHVVGCLECVDGKRCAAYWNVMLDRARVKNRGQVC